MDTIPTQVFVDTTDDSIWTEGKTLMPTITKETFLKMYQIILVPMSSFRKNMTKTFLMHYRIQRQN